MSLTQEIIKAVAVPSLSRCLTGDVRDLRKLLILEKTPFPSPLLRAFLKRLSNDLDEGGGVLANLLVRIGRLANPGARRRFDPQSLLSLGCPGRQPPHTPAQVWPVGAVRGYDEPHHALQFAVPGMLFRPVLQTGRVS